MFNLMSAAAAKPNRIKFSSCFFFLPWLEVLLDCSINHCSINHCPVVKYQAGLGLSDAALERSNLILAKTAPGKGDSTETYCISSQPSMVFFLHCSKSQFVLVPRYYVCCTLQPGTVPWHFSIPGSDQTGVSCPCPVLVPVKLSLCSA